MRLIRSSLVLLLLTLCVSSYAQQGGGGWSSSILTTLLSDRDDPAPQVTAASQEGMVLRSYQFKNLHVGDAGRAQTLITILKKLLPVGSELKADVQGNSLHVMTTPSAHSAVYDYLSAVDTPEQQQVSQEIPEDVKKALVQFADSNASAAKLMKSMEATNRSVADLSSQMSSMKTQQTELLKKGGIVLGAILLFGLVIMFLMGRRRNKVETIQPTLLQLEPQAVTTALMPLHNQLQAQSSDALNKIAVQLEAWAHGQHAKEETLKLQLAETMALAHQNAKQTEVALQRLNVGTDRIERSVEAIAVQNDRVSALTNELQTTISELDRTKDEIMALRSTMEREKQATDAQRKALAVKERELLNRESEISRTQATLAALQVMLEETGEPLAPGVISETYAAQAERLAGDPLEDNVVLTAPAAVSFGPATTEFSSSTHTSESESPCLTTPLQFRFLSPDHPES